MFRECILQDHYLHAVQLKTEVLDELRTTEVHMRCVTNAMAAAEHDIVVTIGVGGTINGGPFRNAFESSAIVVTFVATILLSAKTKFILSRRRDTTRSNPLAATKQDQMPQAAFRHVPNTQHAFSAFYRSSPHVTNNAFSIVTR